MASVILIAEAFYMPLDAIPPLFDGWRWYLYQILFKKAFVEHEIGYFNFPSTWKDSTHWTLYIIASTDTPTVGTQGFGPFLST